tara:strand:+ start:313 stop:486 length:174 start_codon:yes stop_codon:yes gene_type:complete
MERVINDRILYRGSQKLDDGSTDEETIREMTGRATAPGFEEGDNAFYKLDGKQCRQQ